MHIATLRPHPTDPNFAVLAVGPDVNPILGRFEPARLSPQHKGYLIHDTDIDSLVRFLRIHGVALADERAKPTTATPPTFVKKPFGALKCANCGYTQREESCDEDCRWCRVCHGCEAPALQPHVIQLAEQRVINERGLALMRAQP
jgi:hypothetical protein